MIRGVECVLLGSEDATKLAEFYKEKVGLETTQEGEMGEDNAKLYAFDFKEGGNLAIVDHSEVKGMNSQPQRVMFNLEVDDMDTEVEKLDNAGVKKVQETYHVEGYGLITTYEDPDGNYFQLVQVRASE